MQFHIDIDISEDELKDAIKKETAERFYDKYSSEERIMRREIKDAVRDVVYESKDIIIDRAVNQAAQELCRKGLPRLIDKLSNGQE